ncbi:MAG: hypothetical protein AB1753_06070 [Thermoproteota archaeon]
MGAMWVMVLAVAAFLVIAVAPINVFFQGSPRLIPSAVQAVIAVAAVALLAFGMSRLKRAYLRKKLDQP